MKLYAGKIKVIAHELARDLVKQELIEVEPSQQSEVALDIESILREYLRTEREINDSARSLMEKRSLDYSSFGRLKREIAKRQNFGIGEDAMGWIVDQLIEMLLYTNNIEEVWADDHELRKAIRPVLRRHMDIDAELDEEVRKRIKNLNEGSTAWDIKYEQMMQEMKRRKGLE